jgi:hypothetical protein
MEVVIQFSVLTISVCVSAAALVLRANKRSTSDVRIQVDRVSSSWLTEYKTRGRSE